MMNVESTKPSFKKQFQELFWWTAPISLVADFIAIVSALSVTQQYSQPSPLGQPTAVEPRVWGIFALSDVVFLTGLLTLFTVVSLLYSGYRFKLASEHSWALILAVFTSLLLVYLYFRLWLGEDWWLFICVVPIIVAVGAVLLALGGAMGAMTGSTGVGTVTPVSRVSSGGRKCIVGSQPRNILEEHNILERDNILQRENILRRENLLKKRSVLRRDNTSETGVKPITIKAENRKSFFESLLGTDASVKPIILEPRTDAKIRPIDRDADRPSESSSIKMHIRKKRSVWDDIFGLQGTVKPIDRDDKG